jgi:putative endonuclease
MSKHRQELGVWGENVAADYLLKEGYLIVDRNVRTPYGEIDIIAKLQDLIVFIEVKTRSSSSFGMPEVSVTPQKQEHIINAIEYFIQEHPDFNFDWRIDVIAIRRISKDLTPEIIHFQNAVSDR